METCPYLRRYQNFAYKQFHIIGQPDNALLLCALECVCVCVCDALKAVYCYILIWANTFNPYPANVENTVSS